MFVGLSSAAMAEPTTLQDLLDIEAIKQLKARYFRLMDTKQWDAWGEVFAEGVVMEVPEADMVVEGRQAVVDAVSGALATAVSSHHGHMPEIEITGPDSATGIWAMFDLVTWDTGDGARQGIEGFGHYHEEYARTADGWQISRVRLERLRVDPV